MKKLLVILSAIAICAGAFTAQAATKKVRRSAKSAPALAVKTGETKQYDYGNGAGSLETRMFTISKKVTVMVGPSLKDRLDCKMSLEYPMEGPDALVEAVRHWIKQQINEKYTGSLTTPNGLMLSEAKSWDGEQVDIDVKIAYSNQKIVTFECNAYFYGGGAHGMSRTTYGTFKFANGDMLSTLDMPPLSAFKIRPLLAALYDVPASELESNGFTVPKAYSDFDPFILADGLYIKWGAYDIAAGAFGEPTVKVATNASQVSGYPVASFF